MIWESAKRCAYMYRHNGNDLFGIWIYIVALCDMFYGLVQRFHPTNRDIVFQRPRIFTNGNQGLLGGNPHAMIIVLCGYKE